MSDLIEQMRAELAIHEQEAARLRAAIKILTGEPDTQDYKEMAMESVAKLVLLQESEPPPRVRNPELQRAIDEQSPSVAIPRGTKLYCSLGCENGDAGGFSDQMALRTHTKRTHDREPTELEKVPR